MNGNGDFDKRTGSEAFPYTGNAAKRQRINPQSLLPPDHATAPIRQRSLPHLQQQSQQLPQQHQHGYPPSATSFQPASALQFTTADLLDPKAAKLKLLQQQRLQQGQALQRPASAAPTAGRGDAYSNGGGLGSMLESLHGVQVRTTGPPKRTVNGYDQATMQPPDTNRRSAMASRSNGSGIMHGVDPVRHDELVETSYRRRKEEVASPVVDLTNDEEDDEVIYNGTVVLAEKEVCYGMIKKVSASIHQVPDYPQGALFPGNGSWWPQIPVKMKRGQSGSIVTNLIDPSGNHFGKLTGMGAQAISSLLDLGIGRPKGFIQPRLRRSEVVGNPTSQIVEMVVTLYGTESSAKKVGNLLGHYNFFLNDPMPGTRDQDFEYKNPHYPSTDDGGSSNGSNGGMRSVGKFSVRTTEEIRNEITGVLDSLERAHKLPEMKPDPRITTDMLQHQKQGLYFMTQKEKETSFDEKGICSSPLWRLKKFASGTRKYINVITGEEMKELPPSCRGGILADEMGLGKTLSILSLIVSTQEQAADYAKQKKGILDQTDNDPSEIFAKTTLLICPLSVLSNWEEQIKAHLLPNTLSYYVYHGNSRTSDFNALAQYDVIITTYALVASDFTKSQRKGESVLQKINYFRIVLDEAHIIREASTAQSKGVCKLEANRRWAVTGTPVQNRLDDLGTLIKFLRLTPFDTKAAFTRYISAPLKSGDPTSMDKLRALVDSVALRRKKDKIDLPPKHDKTVHLEFSPDEKEIYDATARLSRSKMDMVFRKGHLGGQAYVNVLQTILRLRMICASRDLLGNEGTAGMVSSNAIDLDAIRDEESLAMDKKQAFEIYNLMRESDEAFCFYCSKRVDPPSQAVGSPGGGNQDDDGKDSNKEKEKDDVAYGYLTACPHLFCADCGPKHLNEVCKGLGVKVGEWVKCPLCSHELRHAMRELKPCDDPANQRNEKTKKKVVYRNPSTKILALVQQLLANRTIADNNDGNGRVKSVVFSGWTTHLDLIEAAFANIGIQWRRLDGKMSRTQRAEALRAFREEPDVEVMLVSIAAGGVGLNLTAASKVYVMEPQFNPAAEAQAIDRVHRLGQKREVTCIRFIMKSSFEEKIVMLQKKKQRIADLSIGGQGKTKQQRSQEKIDDLKELFQ